MEQAELLRNQQALQRRLALVSHGTSISLPRLQERLADMSPPGTAERSPSEACYHTFDPSTRRKEYPQGLFGSLVLTSCRQ